MKTKDWPEIDIDELSEGCAGLWIMTFVVVDVALIVAYIIWKWLF